jgi:phosphatidylglycerophosphatase C
VTGEPVRPAASGATAGHPGVAAFDFDGTLARRDTLVPFLRHVCGTPRVVAASARAALRARDRDTLKVGAIGHLFRGRLAAEVDTLGRA